MNTYQIHKDAHCFAEFHEGDPSRFTDKFDDKIAIAEFNSCVSFWNRKEKTRLWELYKVTDIETPQEKTTLMKKVAEPRQ